MAEPGERRHIQGDLGVEPIRVDVDEWAATAETGVVDQQIDTTPFIGDSPGDALETTGIGEIGTQDLHLDSGQLRRERFEPFGTTRHDHEVHAGTRQSPRQRFADTARRPGHQRGAEGIRHGRRRVNGRACPQR